MTGEPRKSSDVLLSIEQKIEQLLSIVGTQDLLIKILTNKLNFLIENSNNKEKLSSNIISQAPVINEPINASLPQISAEISTTGFRRTSRPETYTNKSQSQALLQNSKENIEFKDFDSKKEEKPIDTSKKTNKIPVEQRLLDKNGKTIYLANVEIFNSQGESVYKGRTNGIGKWQATLTPDYYKVKITRAESSTKDKIDLIQDIKISGASSSEVLPALICK